MSESSPRRIYGRRGDRRAQVALVCVLIVIGGLVAYIMSSWKPRERIDNVYGKRHGLEAARSVNGTAVLASMFEQQGSRVNSWDRLSPRLRRADTIVWAPDNYQLPTQEQIKWFEDWFMDRPDRTLIYVGRDYDAEVKYWEDILPVAPADQTDRVTKRLKKAKDEQSAARKNSANDTKTAWFNFRRDRKPRRVNTFLGPWMDVADPKRSEIQVGERIVLDAPQTGEVLLGGRTSKHPSGDPERLVVRFQRGGYQENKLIVVANGSFLLNYALINHEHRKLAGRLIDECHPRGDVVFLETNENGPEIFQEDPVMRQPGALEMSSVWPLSAIIPHVVVVGIILCFALFPIFGRPKELQQDDRSDFSKHIDALGILLARTKDYSYAQERVTHYQQRVKHESGSVHKDVSSDEQVGPDPDLSQPYQPRDTGAINFDLPYPALPPFVKPLAEVAIKTARDQGVSLDYSPDSIVQVDEIILEYHRKNKTAAEVGPTVFGLGCYVGQILVQQFGGQWKEPSETTIRSGAGPYMVVQLSRDSLWNPIGKAFKLLENGADDRLITFYQLVTQTRDNS